MTGDLDRFMIGIVIGIRFRANFSIEDQLGNIADRILYSKDSFFNNTMFPQVYSRAGEKVLINEKTGDVLRINNSNIVLELSFSENATNDLNAINEAFNRDIVNGILNDFKITQIHRVGYVKRYIFDIEGLSKFFIDKTIGESLKGVNDINLRFSKKHPIQDAFVKKGVNDHFNVIYNLIKRADREELFVSIDFQKYFDPFLEKSSQLKFNAFLNRIKSHNAKEYLYWLEESIGDKNEQ